VKYVSDGHRLAPKRFRNSVWPQILSLSKGFESVP
jgi:hypothetical protein